MKFEFNWPSGFRGEDVWKCWRTERRRSDWYTISSPLSLRLRWANEYDKECHNHTQHREEEAQNTNNHTLQTTPRHREEEAHNTSNQTLQTSNSIVWKILFVWFDSLRPINNLSVIKGRVFLCWTSTKLGLMFLLKDTTQWRLWGSNPRPFGLESSALPLSHCAPYRVEETQSTNNQMTWKGSPLFPSEVIEKVTRGPEGPEALTWSP